MLGMAPTHQPERAGGWQGLGS